MNANEVIKTVAEVCGCTADEIKSSLRLRHLVAARRIIAFVLHDYGCVQTGRLINRHHATVCYYRRTFRDDVKYDGYLRARYKNVLSKTEGL